MCTGTPLSWANRSDECVCTVYPISRCSVTRLSVPRSSESFFFHSYFQYLNKRILEERLSIHQSSQTHAVCSLNTRFNFFHPNDKVHTYNSIGRAADLTDILVFIDSTFSKARGESLNWEKKKHIRLGWVYSCCAFGCFLGYMLEYVYLVKICSFGTEMKSEDLCYELAHKGPSRIPFKIGNQPWN